MQFGNLFIHHQWAFLYKCGDASNQGERQPLTSKNHQALQFKEWFMIPLHLPLLNQIQDSLLGMKDAVMSSPPRDVRNVTGPHLVGVAQVH